MRSVGEAPGTCLGTTALEYIARAGTISSKVLFVHAVRSLL